MFVQQNLATGDSCTTCPESSSECGIFFGTQVALTSDWTAVSIPWRELSQFAAGSTAFAPDQLLLIKFEAPAAERFEFLFWLWAVLPALAGIGCGDEDTSSDPVDESDPTVVADTYAMTSENRLVYFERASGRIRSSAEISGLAGGESILGVDFRPAGGELYALASTGKLYTVDPATGAATLKSTLAADAADMTSPYGGLQGDVFGVNFNPVADRLRVVSDASTCASTSTRGRRARMPT